MTRKLPSQARHNKKTFRFDPDDFMYLLVCNGLKVVLCEGVTWSEQCSVEVIALKTTDTGIRIGNASHLHEPRPTIELKHVDLPFAYVCQNMTIDGHTLRSLLRDCEHATTEAAWRQVHLTNLAKRGLVRLTIRHLPSIDPEVSYDDHVVFTLEIAGVPYSVIPSSYEEFVSVRET